MLSKIFFSSEFLFRPTYQNIIKEHYNNTVTVTIKKPCCPESNMYICLLSTYLYIYLPTKILNIQNKWTLICTKYTNNAFGESDMFF